ncbi:hypothetical protein CRM22_003513 [Opisthorchis felineus]|uniref:Major facilitator superfamily (MFS) profile domain-containing protein n=3 Tax=Opisthorchis felineus TaxID=147828 RepID=A0A4S2M0U6_OPIFE|nr:hypothetical protein CRM22_003513 [Opisthorchis felineus]
MSPIHCTHHNTFTMIHSDREPHWPLLKVPNSYPPPSSTNIIFAFIFPRFRTLDNHFWNVRGKPFTAHSILMGLYSEILGPTLPTLMYQTGAGYREIGTALSVRAVGMFCGSLIGGWSSDKWAYARSFQIALALLIAAVTNVLIPLARSIPVLSTILFWAGCSHGYLTTNGNPLLGSIWESKASGPFSLMHAGYGLGGALAPMLVAPFTIHTDSNKTENMSISLIVKDLYANNGTETVLIDPIAPYNLVAAILFSCALCFIPFSGLKNCPSPRHFCLAGGSRRCSCLAQSQVSKDSALSNSCPIRTRDAFHTLYSTTRYYLGSLRAKTKRTDVLLATATFIIYFAVVGNERVFGKFMFTYAIAGPVGMSPANGYILNLLYWVFFGGARVLTFFLAMCIPANPMLLLVTIGTILVSIALTLVPSTEPWFFAFTCLFSLFKSPLFPATLASINQSYEITGLLVLVVNLGSACGASLLQFTAGSLIDTYGQHIFPYLVCGSAVVVLVTVTLLLVLLRHMGSRFTERVETVELAGSDTKDGDEVDGKLLFPET